jgi:hypothetical protein
VYGVVGVSFFGAGSLERCDHCVETSVKPDRDRRLHLQDVSPRFISFAWIVFSVCSGHGVGVEQIVMYDVIRYPKIQGEHWPSTLEHVVSLLTVVVNLHKSRYIVHGDIRLYNIVFSRVCEIVDIFAVFDVFDSLLCVFLN